MKKMIVFLTLLIGLASCSNTNRLSSETRSYIESSRYEDNYYPYNSSYCYNGFYSFYHPYTYDILISRGFRFEFGYNLYNPYRFHSYYRPHDYGFYQYRRMSYDISGISTNRNNNLQPKPIIIRSQPVNSINYPVYRQPVRREPVYQPPVYRQPPGFIRRS